MVDVDVDVDVDEARLLARCSQKQHPTITVLMQRPSQEDGTSLPLAGEQAELMNSTYQFSLKRKEERVNKHDGEKGENTSGEEERDERERMRLRNNIQPHCDRHFWRRCVHITARQTSSPSAYMDGKIPAIRGKFRCVHLHLVGVVPRDSTTLPRKSRQNKSWCA